MLTERWHHAVARLHSALFDVRQIAYRYSWWHRRLWPQACSSASCRVGKSIHSVSQSIRPNYSSVGASYDNIYRYGTVDMWVGSEAIKRQMTWQEVWLSNQLTQCSCRL